GPARQVRGAVPPAGGPVPLSRITLPRSSPHTHPPLRRKTTHWLRIGRHTVAEREKERRSLRTLLEPEALLTAVSHQWWTDDPAPTRALLDQLEADLAAGPEQFAGAWGRGVIRNHSL